MKIKYSSVLFVVLVLIVGVLHAQDRDTNREAETSTAIPALTEFHTVIYQIWHKGWPEKDITLLRNLVPEIERGVKSINATELPGILHEKKPLWDKQVESLNAVAAEYKEAAEKNERNRLLDAAEKLHSCFEGLVRVVRPAMKEMMEFHKVLYGFYHYDLPAKDMGKIGPSVLELKKAMQVLDSAAIPARMKSRTAAFTSQRAKLSASVDELCSAVDTGDLQKTAEAAETMHSNYQALEKIFE